jgi:hypothetical protein
MRTKILSLFFIWIFQFSFGQARDTTKVAKEFRRHGLSQTTISNCLRAGIGIQKSFQSEIGYSRLTYSSGCTGFFSKDYYGALEWIPKTPSYKPVYALKAGFEATASGVSIALETKYQTNWDQKDIVITPKIGIGIGFAYLFYGYNISTFGHPFPSVNNHQFSLVFNLPITKEEK